MTALDMIKQLTLNFMEQSSIIFILQEASAPYSVKFISKNIKKVLGLDEQDIPDLNSWVNRIHVEDRKEYDEQVLKGFGKETNIEYRFLHTNGSYKWLREELKKNTIDSETFILRTIIDITNTKQQTELYKMMFNNIEEGLVSLNKGLEIINLNDGFCSIIGKSYSELIGKNFLKIFEDKGYIDEKKILEELLAEIFVNKIPLKASIRLFNVNSQPRYIDVHLYPVKSYTSEEVEAVIVVLIDVTEKKFFEDQLSYIQKMETVGQLSAGIAHDFNNLLTAIIGFASFIDLKIEENSPLKTYIQNILKVSERGANLVRNLLTFSRKEDFRPTVIDINKLILNSEPLLKKMIGEHISMKIEPFSQEILVRADITQIEQVLLNLVSNARDAISGNGEIKIKTELAKIDDKFIKQYGFGFPGEYVVVSVSDNGMGMSEEVKKRVFEPFFTTKEVNKGTGLGLAIVYSIIKQHNGYITIDTKEGYGTKVLVYLPLIKEHIPTEEEIKKVFLDVRGGDETILVAEDDDYVRDLIKQILVNAGYKVILAKDGKEAIREFIKHKNEISLAILDVIMPMKNGGEVFNEIRLVNPAIKVIFLSGYSTEFIDHETSMSKKAVFMAKPVSPKELLLKVRQALDGTI